MDSMVGWVSDVFVRLKDFSVRIDGVEVPELVRDAWRTCGEDDDVVGIGRQSSGFLMVVRLVESVDKWEELYVP